LYRNKFATKSYPDMIGLINIYHREFAKHIYKSYKITKDFHVCLVRKYGYFQQKESHMIKFNVKVKRWWFHLN